MKKLLYVSMMCVTAIACAAESAGTTTQVKEQIQRIQIPSHVKGVRFINHNTLTLHETSHYPHALERARAQDASRMVGPSRWYNTALGTVCCTTALGAALIYTGMRLAVHTMAQELEKESHWWNWKSELSPAALPELSEKQLAQELAAHIRERYNKKTVNDVAFIMPLVHFIQDTNNEQGHLELTIKFYESLYSYGVHHLVGADEQVPVNARAKLARLNYIRGLFMKWLSTYAVDVPAVA